MKRLLMILTALCLALTMVACSAGNTAPTATPEISGTPVEEAKALKLGMAIVTELSGADASADGNGNAQADSTVAVVLLDGDNKIVDCIIDVAQNKMAFATKGEVLEKDKEFKTKRELGDAYNMAARAQKGEWYVQAAGFEQYVIGKTAAEVSGIAVDEGGAPTDETLKATTTIKVGSFIEAVVEACNNAADLGAVQGDKLGLGVYTTMADSTDASADGDGVCYAYSTYSAVTVNAEGKVTSAVVDATQSKIKVSTAGKITTDLAATEVKSKNVLKEEYGMLARSAIGLEWYQQAAGYCEYIKGKTAAEIEGIALDEGGAPADETLKATTTIHISDFTQTVVKAIADAQ